MYVQHIKLLNNAATVYYYYSPQFLSVTTSVVDSKESLCSAIVVTIRISIGDLILRGWGRGKHPRTATVSICYNSRRYIQ